MLQPGIYKQIYKIVYKLPDLDIIEIGGASGAGSIAAAWAMWDSRKKSKLIVVEKCEGGSRAQFGTREDNYDKIKQNFKRFDVDEQIILYPH